MERRTELLALTDEQVGLLAAAGLPGETVTAFEPMHGGRANTLLRVRLASGRAVVLRCYTRDAGCAAKEAALARFVRDGVPVPEPLGHVPAGTVGGVDHPVVFWSHAEGRPLHEAGLKLGGNGLVALARELGRILGRLRSFTFQVEGDLRAPGFGEAVQVTPWGFAAEGSGEGEHGGFVRHCLENTPAGMRLGTELRERVAAYFAHCAERWPDPSVASPTLVHADFGPQNLMVELDADGGTPRVTAVLDWEFAHAGDPLADIGNLLRRRAELEVPPQCDAALAQGFADEGIELPEAWPQRARSIDLTSALEFLSSEDDRPESHARALAQIRDTLERDFPFPTS